MDLEQTVAAVRRYLDAANDGDVDAMVAATTADFQFRTPRSVLNGHDELRASMAEPQSMSVMFVPTRWFARGAAVVCFMDARYSWADSGESAGEEPRFVRALVRDGRLALLQVGYPDGETVLKEAELTEDDEIAMRRS
jgi:hypothetical protein